MTHGPVEWELRVRPSDCGGLHYLGLYFRTDPMDEWSFANSLCLTTPAYRDFLDRFPRAPIGVAKAGRLG